MPSSSARKAARQAQQLGDCATPKKKTRVNAIKVTTDIEDTDLRYLCLSVLAQSFPGYGYPLSSYHDSKVCESPEQQEERQREAGRKLMPLLLVASSKGSNLERIAQVWWECEVAVQWHDDTSQLGIELANTIDPILEYLGEAEFKAEFGDTFRQSAKQNRSASRLPVESGRSALSAAIETHTCEPSRRSLDERSVHELQCSVGNLMMESIAESGPDQPVSLSAGGERGLHDIEDQEQYLSKLELWYQQVLSPIDRTASEVSQFKKEAELRELADKLEAILLLAVRGFAEGEEACCDYLALWWGYTYDFECVRKDISLEGKTLSTVVDAETKKICSSELLTAVEHMKLMIREAADDDPEECDEVVSVCSASCDFASVSATPSGASINANPTESKVPKRVRSRKYDSSGSEWPGFKIPVPKDPSGMTYRQFMHTVGNLAITADYSFMSGVGTDISRESSAK